MAGDQRRSNSAATCATGSPTSTPGSNPKRTTGPPPESHRPHRVVYAGHALDGQEEEVQMPAIVKPGLNLPQVRAMTVAALTRAQTAELLGVDPRTVTRGIAEG